MEQDPIQISVSKIAESFNHKISKQCQDTKIDTKHNNYHKSPNIAFGLASESLYKRQRAQRLIGIKEERKGIDKYERLTGHVVNFRNTRLLEIKIDKYRVVGRVDGIRDDDIIIEHKRRCHGLSMKLPFSEKIQCTIYMKMLGLDTTHVVETYADDIKIHVLRFNPKIWDIICRKLTLPNVPYYL